MKKGWECKSFEDCIIDVEYTRKIQRKDFLQEGHFPIISQEADFINGYWNDAADVFRAKSPVVIFGDHTQALKYIDFDFVLGADGVKILKPQDFLFPRFFFYQLQSFELPSLGYARHYRQLRERNIIFPPLAEQKRIVALLDEAFAGLATAQANAEKNLQNARALFESQLQTVFSKRGEGWVEKTLEDVVADDCSLSYGIVQPGDDYDTGLPVVRPTDLTSDTIKLKGLKRIDPKRAESYQRTKLRGRELLLCVRGTTGIVSKASIELVGANVTRGIVPIRLNSNLLQTEFGFYLLRSGPVQSQILAKTYGAALMQINIGDLRKISVSFPSMRAQEVIAAHLDALSAETQRLAKIYEQKQAALAALKKSLLHQAFSGEL